MLLSNRLFCLLFACFLPVLASAQQVFSGTGGYADGYVYEDAMLDDGTRFIISDMRQFGRYSLSLCLSIAPDGERNYFLAVESDRYIPRNAMLVFFFKGEDSLSPLVLKSCFNDQAMSTSNSLSVNPIFFLDKSGGIALATSRKEKISNVCYALFGLSEEQIEKLSTNEPKEIRISSRSRYNIIYPLNDKQWLIKSKQRVDARAKLSVNTILEE